MQATSNDSLDAVRASVRDRVLWLATSIVNHANNVRSNPDGTKVGGHQSSSASSVAILSALFFETLEKEDRIAIKPHASPVFHAIQYLLGNLDESYLERFRAYGGLQAYPSRTKDPEFVDFSTGSVGLAGPAASFGALTRDYLETHGLEPGSGRFYAHLGDAELDEGSMWEAVIEPALAGVGRCTWVVDVNRQSLDRVVPGIRVRQFMDMLCANGWTVFSAKYGDRLTELMEAPGGEALRRRIDEMSNEEYQGLLVGNRDELPGRLTGGAPVADRREIERCIANVPLDELYERITNLGGQDVGYLVRLLDETATVDGPTAIFTCSRLAPDLLGAVALAAYSYMALVPIIQPPIIKLLTSKKERRIRMGQTREVPQAVKIAFPIVAFLLTAFIAPGGLPLLGMLFFGNLLRESLVTGRLMQTAQGPFIDIVTILLGVTVGAKTAASSFLTLDTIFIFVLGIAAFAIATATGVLFGKLMNAVSTSAGGEAINPMIGAAGVSAVPMAARVVHKLGLDEDPQNFLIMHAMGPNVAGVIGSAVAAGVLLSALGGP